MQIIILRIHQIAINIKKFTCITFFLVACQIITSQARDTVYLYIDTTHTTMSKGSYLMPKWYSKPKEGEKVDSSRTYFIKERIDSLKYGELEYVTGRYTFNHRIPTKNEIKRMGYKKPIVKRANKSYLLDKKILDYNFFKATDFLKVCKTFEAEDSRKQDVIIFVIDKEEIKNDSITIREVIFSRPVKE